MGRSTTQPTSRRTARGQAMVEFALVLPIIFLFFFGVLAISFFAWDGQVTDHAARAGTDGANAAMAAVKTRNSTDPRLTTAWVSGRNDSAFGTTCRRDANRAFIGASLDANLGKRLGWDWGCLYDRNSGKDLTKAAKVGDNKAAIAAPLIAAITAATDNLTTSQFVGGTGKTTVSACYAIWNNNDATCVFTMTSVNGGAPKVTLAPSAAARSTLPAPSFVIVKISNEAFSLGGGPKLTITRESRGVLDRFLPPCPAGLTCGGIF